MHYHITKTEADWDCSLFTDDYPHFFDEAAKVIHQKFGPAVGPALLTLLPAFENGELRRLRVDDLELGALEYDAI